MEHLLNALSHAMKNYEYMKQMDPKLDEYYDDNFREVCENYRMIQDAFVFDMESILITLGYFLRMKDKNLKCWMVDGVTVDTPLGPWKVIYFCVDGHQEQIQKEVKKTLSSLQDEKTFQESFSLLAHLDDFVLATSYPAKIHPKYLLLKNSLSYLHMEKGSYAIFYEDHPSFSFVQSILSEIIASTVHSIQVREVSSGSFRDKNFYRDCDPTAKLLIPVPDIL